MGAADDILIGEVRRGLPAPEPSGSHREASLPVSYSLLSACQEPLTPTGWQQSHRQSQAGEACVAAGPFHRVSGDGGALDGGVQMQTQPSAASLLLWATHCAEWYHLGSPTWHPERKRRRQQRPSPATQVLPAGERGRESRARPQSGTAYWVSPAPPLTQGW